MKIITLSNGYETRVSDCDYDWLRDFSGWRAHVSNANGKIYARSTSRHARFMHRVITRCPGPYKADHADRDSLNNQRPNLRVMAHDWMHNANRVGWSVSGFKGVSVDRGGWRARISENGEQKLIGRFPDKILAAKAYDAEAFRIFGEFAVLNFPADYPLPDPDIEEMEIPFFS